MHVYVTCISTICTYILLMYVYVTGISNYMYIHITNVCIVYIHSISLMYVYVTGISNYMYRHITNVCIVYINRIPLCMYM